MKITTKLKDAKAVSIHMATPPVPASEIMLAENGDYYLSAARSRNKGGFVMKLVRRSDRQVFPIAGFRATDIKRCNLTMEQLVRYATDYMAKFLAVAPVMQLHADVPLPPAAFSNALNKVKPDFDFSRWPESPEWQVFIAGYNEATRTIIDKSKLQLNLEDTAWRGVGVNRS